MSWAERVQRLARPAGGWRGRLWVSDVVRVRVASTLLWALVVVAGLGGLVGWFRSPPGPVVVESVAADAVLAEGWAAAGFGARFVASYVASGAEQARELERFLGYSPDLPATGPSPEPPSSVTVVGVAAVDEGYWAVTVAAGDRGREGFWRAGVVTQDGRMLASGLPTPVPAPPEGERPDLGVTLSAAPVGDDGVFEAVAGWVESYMCGQGDLSRWLAPGMALGPVTPPVCLEASLDRWGSRAERDDRRVVVAEAVLDPGPDARRVALALEVARRDGRWEVADLLPALPLGGGSGEGMDGETSR